MAQDIQAAEMPETSFYVLITRTGISWSASAVQSVVSNAYQVYPSMPAGFALVKASIVSIGIDFIDVMVAVKNGDAEEIPKAATEAIASITVGALAAIAMGIYGAPIAATIIFGGILSGIGKYLGGLFWENYKKQVDASLAIVPTEEILWGEFEFDFWRIPGGIQPGIRNQCNRYTLDALNWTPPPTDPLVLDLDGGGIRGFDTGSVRYGNHTLSQNLAPASQFVGRGWLGRHPDSGRRSAAS